MNSRQRITEMCKLFADHESNKRVRISFSNSKDGISVFVAFETPEDWIRGKGTYILRQMVKQFKLDMIEYDPQSILSKKIIFSTCLGNKDTCLIISYLSILINSLKKIYIVATTMNTVRDIYLKIYNLTQLVTNLSSSLSPINITYAYS